MGTKWTDFVKKWAAENNLSYGCAMSKPKCREDYRKENPPKQTKKELKADLAKRLSKPSFVPGDKPKPKSENKEMFRMASEDILSRSVRDEEKKQKQKDKEEAEKFLMEEEDVNRAKKKNITFKRPTKQNIQLVIEEDEPSKKRGRQPKYTSKEEAYQAKLAQNREWKKKNLTKKGIEGTGIGYFSVADLMKIKGKGLEEDDCSCSDSEEEEVGRMGGEGITPVARMGGKSKLAKRLIEMFPDFNTYVEPFLGGGNIFLRIPPEELEGKKIVLNDLDKDMYTIFSGLKKDPKGVNEKVNRNFVSRDEFKALKEKTDVLSLITRYKNSFYGMGKSYNPLRKNGKATFTTDYEKIGNKLKNATISNTSFEKLIPKYDSPTTFFYLDPPYENPKQTDYKDYVTPEDVFKSLQGIKGKFMLSYNDSPNIRSIFSKYNIKGVQTEYAGHKGIERRKKMEVIITNY
jgi:DNA adenine methylase